MALNRFCRSPLGAFYRSPLGVRTCDLDTFGFWIRLETKREIETNNTEATSWPLKHASKKNFYYILFPVLEATSTKPVHAISPEGIKIGQPKVFKYSENVYGGLADFEVLSDPDFEGQKSLFGAESIDVRFGPTNLGARVKGLITYQKSAYIGAFAPCPDQHQTDFEDRLYEGEHCYGGYWPSPTVSEALDLININTAALEYDGGGVNTYDLPGSYDHFPSARAIIDFTSVSYPDRESSFSFMGMTSLKSQAIIDGVGGYNLTERETLSTYTEGFLDVVCPYTGKERTYDTQTTNDVSVRSASYDTYHYYDPDQGVVDSGILLVDNTYIVHHFGPNLLQHSGAQPKTELHFPSGTILKVANDAFGMVTLGQYCLIHPDDGVCYVFNTNKTDMIDLGNLRFYVLDIDTGAILYSSDEYTRPAHSPYVNSFLPKGVIATKFGGAQFNRVHWDKESGTLIEELDIGVFGRPTTVANSVEARLYGGTNPADTFRLTFSFTKLGLPEFYGQTYVDIPLPEGFPADPNINQEATQFTVNCSGNIPLDLASNNNYPMQISTNPRSSGQVNYCSKTINTLPFLEEIKHPILPVKVTLIDLTENMTLTDTIS